MKPLKKFGQNYLIDKNIVNKMIGCLDIKKTDAVLEIGPGKGFITEELYGLTQKLICVEIDSRIISDLRENFPKMKILHEDFNNTDIAEIKCDFPIKVIGNIPFNQTGNILFKLIKSIEYISDSALIIPHDIAKRLVAEKRSKEYGILTVLFNYYSTPKIIAKVSRNVFIPKPNMDSAIVLIKFNKPLNKSLDKKLFNQVVKASFGNRRKTLYNSLRNSIFKDCDFSSLDLPLSRRAEEFSVDDYIYLTEYLQCQKKIK